MNRDLLPHLPVLVAVARRGGFAAAATELGISPSAVSHAVKLVEDRIGAPLFARTTRSVALTELGRTLIDGVATALSLIDEQLDGARAARGSVAGILRLNVPRIALPLAMNALIARLAKAHPDLVVETFVDDGLRDIVAEEFDAGVRVGAMIAKDMVAVRLTPPYRTLVVASPDYLDRAGTPGVIEDLARHRCINYRLVRGRNLYRWDMERDGVDIAIDVGGGPIVNDMLFALDLARDGLGLAYTFEPLCIDDIRAKRLVVVLERHAVQEEGLFLYFPSRARQSPKLRACIEVARALATAEF
jgi:DNA-binding transcriptional LysR family regulator